MRPFDIILLGLIGSMKPKLAFNDIYNRLSYVDDFRELGNSIGLWNERTFATT